MDSQPRGCAAPAMGASSSVAPAGWIATAQRGQGASPIGKRVASNAWSPSASRMLTASLALSAAASRGGAPALSSAAASPWGPAARGKPATFSLCPRREPVRRGSCATGASAASRAGGRTRRAVLRAMPARRMMTGQPVFRTAARWAVLAGSGASSSTTRPTSASRRCGGNAPRHRARGESGATCGCCAVAESSGARGSAIRSARTAALRSSSAASEAGRSAPATVDVSRWTRIPVARGASAPPSRRI